MIALAEQAIAAWGGSTKPPRLISHRENAVFAVTMRDGQKAALRLHRPGYNSVAEIKSELWWSKALAARDFPVPEPIANLSGELLHPLPDGQIATVICWVEGAPIGATDEPLGGSPEEQVKLYQHLGALLARLHTESDALTYPADFQRRNWDQMGLLGDAPLWGRFWENPALTPDIQNLIDTARTKAATQLQDYAKSADFGMIHADALRENVFRKDAELTLIDFDDAGYGFRLYDLAVALSQSLEDDNYQQLKSAIITGYQQTRALSERDIALFRLFTMLRSFASLGWAMPRVAPGDPGMQRYVRRAELAARIYLS